MSALSCSVWLLTTLMGWDLLELRRTDPSLLSAASSAAARASAFRLRVVAAALGLAEEEEGAFVVVFLASWRAAEADSACPVSARRSAQSRTERREVSDGGAGGDVEGWLTFILLALLAPECEAVCVCLKGQAR